MTKMPFLAVVAAVFSAVLFLGCGDPDPDPSTPEPNPPGPVQSVNINDGDLSLMVMDRRQLSVTVLPEDALNRELDWTSSDTNIVSFRRGEGGTFTALRPGAVTITATARDGSGHSDSIEIMVTGTGQPMTPQEIFETFRGQRVTTGGWADLANDGEGLFYANPAELILIDEYNFPDPVARRLAFTDALRRRNTTEPGDAFIIVSGDIDLSDGLVTDDDHSWFMGGGTRRFRFHIYSNTTIIGINNARLMFGGFQIEDRYNVIIKNITFWDAHGNTANLDALELRGRDGFIPTGIWVHHSKFTDGLCDDPTGQHHDGLFDIRQGQVTASWNEFTNHNLVMLVGSNDTYLEPEERRVTLHHNRFHHARQRMPRTRGTQMHIYSNYFHNIGQAGHGGEAMAPGVNARFVVQNNHFRDVHNNNFIRYYDNTTHPAIVWAEGNNVPIQRAVSAGGSKPWEPGDFYEYVLTPLADVPDLVRERAGPTLVFKK